MVLVALAMVAIIAMAALSIDVITLYLARRRRNAPPMQRALAAARVISLSGMTGDPSNSTVFLAADLRRTRRVLPLKPRLRSHTEPSGARRHHRHRDVLGRRRVACATTVSVGRRPFGVNPMVTVQVYAPGLPTFFSRIWGNTGNTVSATATAEAFNPSESDIRQSGHRVDHPGAAPLCEAVDGTESGSHQSTACTGDTCHPFVDLREWRDCESRHLAADTTGSDRRNIYLTGRLRRSAVPCTSPTAGNSAGGGLHTANASRAHLNLEYLPGQVLNPPLRCQLCCVWAGGKCDVCAGCAGCDQTTVYQCGVQSSIAATPNMIDLTENPGGRRRRHRQCNIVLNQRCRPQALTSGQDTVERTASIPFQIHAGTCQSPLSGLRGNPITSSNSIVSLPIYDNSVTRQRSGTTAVTIVGFLQVFINRCEYRRKPECDRPECGGLWQQCDTTAPIPGTSPVPVRLVTPP